MRAQSEDHDQAIQPLTVYRSILLAVDSSDHSNQATRESVALAQLFNSRLSASHVYAAKLHDLRFRQMEGGLPEQFREEQELERQRDVHDTLISKGLSIITDSYLDQVERIANPHQLQIRRRSLEGKNYRELVNESNSGDYDLLVMGALGLGAVQGSRLGTVCQRVTRRSRIDTLIIRQPQRSLSEGPIVVGIDGSAKSYGGLLTALSLGRLWQVPVKVISAFDPYYHYVAFNRIAGVLTKEAGEVFRFQEQEQLHEEIIDSGLAKIYQGHLAVAQGIAKDYGMEIETVLLDGKPHEVMLRYLQETNPALLILGTTGIHADAALDIGGNTEYLLNDAPCAVLLSQQTFTPQVDRLAEVTTSWTHEAEQRMQRVPDFVRPMARMAILRYAQEQGHTVITEGIVEEATTRLMPNHAEQAMEEIVAAHDSGRLKQKPDAAAAMRWSDTATRLLLTIKDLSLRGNLSMRAEKKARTDGKRLVEAAHLKPFLDDRVITGAFDPAAEAATLPGNGPPPHSAPQPAADPADKPPASTWQSAALARLMRVPEGFMRDSSRQRVEAYAANHGIDQITLQVAEAGLAEARQAMAQQIPSSPPAGDPAEETSGCPFAARVQADKDTESDTGILPRWHSQALMLLTSVPAGFCRDMTRKAAESIARQKGLPEITQAFVEQVMETFKAGSDTSRETLPWNPAARERIQRAPERVRGMLVQEIEGWSRRNGIDQVTEAAVAAVKQIWADRGVFHLDPDDQRNH